MSGDNGFVYPHLELINVPHDKNERYKFGGGIGPSEKDREEHSRKIKKEIDEVQETINIKAQDTGINPRLIFKIEYENSFSKDQLRRAGFSFLGDLPGNKAQVVFSDQEGMEIFLEKWCEYSEGELTDKEYPQYRSVFDNIMSIKPLDADDRKGPKLKNEEIIDDEKYWLDIDLWHRGSEFECKKDRKDLEKIMNQNGEITDYYVSNNLHLLRVKANGLALKKLLEQEMVCQIDFPPKLRSEAIKKINLDIDDINFGKPNEDATGICIIDSGIMPNHDLLKDALVHYDVFRDDLEDGIDESGHGTFVAGIALYGAVKECIEEKAFIPEVKLFSARVTDKDDSLGPSEILYIKQIKKAIEYYNDEFDCRVFNISLGDPEKIFMGNQYQSPWAQILDNLARERDLIIVIPTGNINETHFYEDLNLEGEEIVEEYPGYLFKKEAGLLDPSTATNCITVGSIANELRTSRGLINRNEKELDIKKVPIAKVGQPAPFTRIGLGINDTIKPEFITYGGNMYFDGNQERLIGGSGVETGTFSLNYNFINDNRLFSCDIGTSYAAPVVANLAARVLNYNSEFTNNTVRALLANSAIRPSQVFDIVENHMKESHIEIIAFLDQIKDELNIDLNEKIINCSNKGHITKSDKKDFLKSDSLPQQLKNLLRITPGRPAEFEEYLLRVSGYGVPDLEKALYSSEGKVTMYAEGSIGLDSFDVYELPIPDDFTDSKGIRRIIVSLAYSPPTRNTRKEYCGYSLNLELIRGKSIEEVLDIASNDDKDRKYSELGAERCELLPKKNLRSGSTLQRGVFERKQRDSEDYGDTYYLVVEFRDNWFGNSASFREGLMEDYSIVVTLEHENEEVEIYQDVKQRIEEKIEEQIEQGIRQPIKIKS